MGSGLENTQLYSLLDSEVYLPQKQVEISEHMNAKKADFWTNFILSCVLQGSCLKCVSCSSSHQGHILLLTWLMYLWVDLDSLPLSPEGDILRPFKQAANQWPSSNLLLKKAQSLWLTLTLVLENKSKTQRELCSIRRKLLISINNSTGHTVQSLRSNYCLEFWMSRQAGDLFPLEEKKLSLVGLI